MEPLIIKISSKLPSARIVEGKIACLITVGRRAPQAALLSPGLLQDFMLAGHNVVDPLGQSITNILDLNQYLK